MNLLSMGINHKMADLSLREKVAVKKDHLPKILTHFQDSGFEESLVLSTCNRMEVYACSKDRNLEDLCHTLHDYFKLSDESLLNSFYQHRDIDVADHLFRVTSSLDSMVLGEPEIVGQVKSAYQCAQDHGSIHKILSNLFQKSFNISKRIRTHTRLSSRPVSVGSVAASLAEQIFGHENIRSILMLGAGDMAEVCLDNLIGISDQARIVIANRTLSRAQTLAQRYEAQACSLDDLDLCLESADIVIGSLAVDEPFIQQSHLKHLHRLKKGRPLFFIDMGVPRNINPSITELEDVYLYDMDNLQECANENLHYRESLRNECEPFISEGVGEFQNWLDSLENQNLIAEIKKNQEELIQSEYNKAKNKLGSMDEDSEKQILYLLRKVTNKMMHHPIRNLRGIKKSPSSSSEWRKFFFEDP